MIEIIPNWHPIFVKFGYALTVSGMLAGVALCLGLRTLREPLMNFAQIAMALGALALAGAAVSGFWAFGTVTLDTHSARFALNVHRNWAVIGAGTAMLVTAATLAAPTLLQRRAWALALLLPVLALSWAAMLGAGVVYRHGVGVLP